MGKGLGEGVMAIQLDIEKETCQRVRVISAERSVTGGCGVMVVEADDGRRYDCIFTVRNGVEKLKRGSVRAMGE